MPIPPTYPGVYIEEVPSTVRVITGVSTSTTAFIGLAKKGPTDYATTIHSFADYERIFGGLWKESNMSYAIYQYFLNGGTDAVIVRVVPQDAKPVNFETEECPQGQHWDKEKQKCIDTTPPSQVTGLTVTTQSSTRLNLVWTANTDTDLLHYNVYRGKTAGFTVNTATAAPVGQPSTNSFSDTGLTPSTTYFYRVAAVDGSDNIGALSTEASGATTTTTTTDTTPPSQVTGLTVTTQSSTRLNLVWTANTDTDLLHYNVYRGKTAGFTVNTATAAPVGQPSTNSFSDTGLTPSTTYFYRVAAVDGSDNIGALSTEASGATTTTTTTDTTPPSQVTGLTVTTQSSTRLNLVWTANTDTDLLHYNVYRGKTAGFTVNTATAAPVGQPSTNSFSDTGLTPSTTYFYRVAAVDGSDNIGALSTEASGATTTTTTTDTTPPSQVTGLTVTTQSSTRLNLVWTANTDTDLLHYNVYRGKTAGFTVNTATAAPVGQPSTNSFSDTGLTPSTTYFYRVAAVDGSDNIGALSTEASGATKAPAEPPEPPRKLILEASNPGLWAKDLKITVEDDDINTEINTTEDPLFNIVVENTELPEKFYNISSKPDNPQYITTVLKEESNLIRIPKDKEPAEGKMPSPVDKPLKIVEGSGSDGTKPLDITGSAAAKTGIYALDNIDHFNMLCIPPYNKDEATKKDKDIPTGVYDKALDYCKERHAMLIVDSPSSWDNKEAARTGIDKLPRSKDAAIFFPHIKAPDPLQHNRLRDFVPCGAVAGVIARIDSQRGVWKAPAGIEANLIGVSDLDVRLTD